MGMNRNFIPQLPGVTTIVVSTNFGYRTFNEVKEWGEYRTRNADDKIVKAS